MPKNDLTGIGDILQKLKKTTKLGKSLEIAQIWDNWEELAGKELAMHGRPQTVRDMQLRIEADSAVWMHKFSYHKWTLIKRVNRMAKKELINDIFVTLVGDGESIDDDDDKK